MREHNTGEAIRTHTGKSRLPVLPVVKPGICQICYDVGMSSA